LLYSLTWRANSHFVKMEMNWNELLLTNIIVLTYQSPHMAMSWKSKYVVKCTMFYVENTLLSIAVTLNAQKHSRISHSRSSHICSETCRKGIILERKGSLVQKEVLCIDSDKVQCQVIRYFENRNNSEFHGRWDRLSNWQITKKELF